MIAVIFEVTPVKGRAQEYLDLAAALKKDAKAKKTFDALSYSNKGWHVSSIEGAKTDETRQRRIAKSVAALREGSPR